MPSPLFRSSSVAVFLGLVSTGISGAAPDSAPPVDFQKQIQPILAEHCTQCHGPDESNRKADLRLDIREEALLERKGSRAIVPGNPGQSTLVERVEHADADEIMPPPKTKKPLSSEQKALLRRWIAEGAPYTVHWAFAAPKMPPVPQVSSAASPLDAFIRSRLAQAGLKPSPEADRHTLLRRAALDLTGLPPTPRQIEDYLSDTRPDAYVRMIDSLLASAHFGERWARHWLDLARYADSDGYEKDTARPFAYLFRDWVIEAINADMPFDQFTVRQLAGDLMPGATAADRIATGFHRQTLTNREGGVDQEEFRCKAVVDRASTTGTVWMGLTVGCAECHSHKFDPISQREFFQLYAFFNDASEQGFSMQTPENERAHQVALQEWKTKGDSLEKERLTARDRVKRDALVQWETKTAHSREIWRPLTLTSVVAKKPGGKPAPLKPDADGFVSSKNRGGVISYTLEASLDAVLDKGPITGIRVQALPNSLFRTGDGKNGQFELAEISLTVQAPQMPPQKIPLQVAGATGDAAKLAFALDGKPQTGWSPGTGIEQLQNAYFTLDPAALAGLAPLAGGTLRVELQFGDGGGMTRFAVFATQEAGPWTATQTPDAVRGHLAVAAAERRAEAWEAIREHYADWVDPLGMRVHRQIRSHVQAKPELQPLTAAVLAAESRTTRIHVRGDFLQKGDSVEPGVFGFMPPLQARAKRPDRLDLARWLMDPANPLTARVTVNHFWKQLFGRGLVATENDFGTRGERPSHPELLDWLALEFQRMGWSRKAFLKMIVLSDTYRQSSQYREDVQETDPLNILLARQNRLRMEAEVVRDAALQVSGLLNPRLGGPSIKPPLPPDLAALNYAGGLRWEPSTGADLYRRGLYIHFQRTVPYPMLMTFDAPESNVTCTRRDRSNTPLQALTLLNNGLFLESARALGRHLVTEAATAEQRVERAFVRVLGRRPTPEETARLTQFLKVQNEFFDRNPNQAEALLQRAPAAVAVRPKNRAGKGGQPESEAGENTADKPSETAALVALSRVLLNLDEAITRD
jgi:hypothetical protein